MPTSRRSQRFGGHARRPHYCSCGKRMYGNGSATHFLAFAKCGHAEITRERWERAFPEAAADWRFGDKP